MIFFKFVNKSVYFFYVFKIIALFFIALFYIFVQSDLNITQRKYFCKFRIVEHQKLGKRRYFVCKN